MVAGVLGMAAMSTMTATMTAAVPAAPATSLRVHCQGAKQEHASCRQHNGFSRDCQHGSFLSWFSVLAAST
jgi:hypothetical protein